jgi:hypothetical protein
VVPLQQPCGHDVASHTHCPLTQSWFEPQPPQVAPFVPHDVID